MNRSILLCVLLISCMCSMAQTTKPVAKPKANDNIRFDFKAGYNYTTNDALEIKGSLYNDNTDTAYFLTSTCNGIQYSLQYDTTKYTLIPLIMCNASFAAIGKIAPKEKLDFTAYFKPITNEKRIKLGFDFYKVENTINLENIKLSMIHNRPVKERNVKWAEAGIN